MKELTMRGVWTKDDIRKLTQVIDYYDGDMEQVGVSLMRAGVLNGDPYTKDPRVALNMLAVEGAFHWRTSAYPSVVMGHRYAAMLISTKITPSVRAMARLPWRAVWFEIPKGLLDVPEAGITPSGVLVWEAVGCWHMWGPAGAKVIGGAVRGTEESEPFSTTETIEWSQAYVHEGTAEDRVLEAISRLVINSCLAMSDPANIRNLPPGSGGSLRSSNAPTSYTYQLGKPPNVDCRPALQAYLRGTRKGASPTVQTLVAGHWKPKLGERVGRPVYVEPYWRGPEDAPIKVQQKALKPPTP